MKNFKKEDFKKIKHFKVLSKNKVLVSFKNSPETQIIKGKITKDKIKFPKVKVKEKPSFNPMLKI